MNYYLKFENYSLIMKQMDSYEKQVLEFIKLGMTEALSLVGQIAVSKFMVEAKVVYKAGRKEPKIIRTQREKLNIVTTRLARSISDQYSFAQGAQGENEGIRTIKRRGNKIIGTIGSKVPYAAIHEYGGRITFKKRGGTITIPARPYLRPALAKAEPKIKKIFEKRLEEGLDV